MAFAGLWDWFTDVVNQFRSYFYPSSESEVDIQRAYSLYEEELLQLRVESEEEKAKRLAEEKAQKYGVPSWLVKAIIHVESGWNPYARSWLGAMGLMQLMPETAKWLGFNPKYLYDIETNLEAGVSYLSYLLKKYGNYYDAIAAYNRGYAKKTSKGTYVNQGYVNRVLRASEYYT